MRERWGRAAGAAWGLALVAVTAASCCKKPDSTGPADAEAVGGAAAAPGGAGAAPAPPGAGGGPAPQAAAAAGAAVVQGGGAAADHAPGCEEPPAEAEPGARAAQQPPGTVYGAGVAAAERVQISVLLANIDAWVGKKVQVEGVVTDVCPMRGCWFELAGDQPETSLRFKVRDGVMVFPLSAKGQRAVAEGVVRKIPLDLERSRAYLAHLAEEKGEPFDPASVREPVTIVRLDGTGAVLRDQP
jgi:hypothetical protein